MEVFESKSIADTERIAQTIAEKVKRNGFLALYGGMGAGKTAFTRGLAKGLGLDDHVSSPTFALVHQYGSGANALYHFDMYRITDSDDLYSTGFYEYLERPGIVAAEWCEMIPEDLPEHRYEIRFERVSDSCRNITIEEIGA